MAEENDKNTYGAVENTRPLNEDETQERVRSVDSFYEDQPGENDNKRTLLDTDAEKGHLHEKQVEKQEEKPNEANDNAQNHQHNNNGITPTERLQRPTRVSFSKEQPNNANNGAVTPVTSIGRHVSFINEANQNEPNDVGVAYDNRACSDMQSSSDSLSRVRAITNCSVHYHTHSEGEECNESDISFVISHRRSSQTRRRRRYTRAGTLVSDSFVNECICCCTII
ncbi:hypothetical protein ACROYT_G003662 [Oculina patagonica]